MKQVLGFDSDSPSPSCDEYLLICSGIGHHFAVLIRDIHVPCAQEEVLDGRWQSEFLKCLQQLQVSCRVLTWFRGSWMRRSFERLYRLQSNIDKGKHTEWRFHTPWKWEDHPTSIAALSLSPMTSNDSLLEYLTTRGPVCCTTSGQKHGCAGGMLHEGT